MVTSYELYANSTSEITQILLHFDQAVAVNGTTNLEADKFMVCCRDNLEECDQVRQGAMSTHYTHCVYCVPAALWRGVEGGAGRAGVGAAGLAQRWLPDVGG